MENPLSNVSVAEVLLDDALAKTLDYSIPISWQEQLQIGMRVQVPVRGSLREGTLVALKQSSPFSKLQPLHKLLLENEAIPSDLFRLAQWISHYYCTSLQIALKAILPPSVRGETKQKMQKFFERQASLDTLSSLAASLRGKSPKQAEILDLFLKSPQGLFLSELTEHKVSKSALATLLEKKLISLKQVPIDRSLSFEADYLPTLPKKLKEEQSQALDAIVTNLRSHLFSVRLIHGITGSGKTEVYLQAIQEALLLNKGVIFLVPEIALTAQMIEKLKSRFQERVAILHSRLSQGERLDAWRGMRKGEIRIAVGARSAIFSPIQSLGLIIVDEEHEASYKSEDSPHYNGRDVAIVRGKITSSTVLLGSATPSLESYSNARNGKYALSTLTLRAEARDLPQITLIDMKEERRKNNQFTLFSDPLIAGIKKRLSLGEQTILFLNRRGYHTIQMCKNCGKTTQCPECDVNLTFHLQENTLSCHLCGYHLSPPPPICPHCQEKETFKFKGIGTELVERSLHALLPQVRTLRIDGDTTKHKGSSDRLFKQFRSGKADVLIGTQMIAKGLHFPHVTLVAVLNADAALQVPDFRAAEHTFQLLTQVAGRSGRGALPGEVLLQTQLPSHPIIQFTLKQNYKEFFESEIATRELFQYPPFNHLVKIICKGKSLALVQNEGEKIRSYLLSHLSERVEILPLVPCGHAKIKGDFRLQFLIKTPQIAPLLPWLKNVKNQDRKIQCIIDIDPLSTFL